MANTIDLIRAQALEVPITLQAAKTVAGSDRPELFSEDAKTTVIFINGFALNLKTHFTAGQPVYVRNQQNGRGILCTVMDAPGETKIGPTRIEFNNPDPDFWTASAATPDAPAPVTASTLAAMPTRDVYTSNLRLGDEIVPTYQVVSPPPPPPPEPEAPPQEAPQDSAKPSAPPAPGSPQQDAWDSGGRSASDERSQQEIDDEEDAKFHAHLAAMVERDARLAKYAAMKEQQTQRLLDTNAAKESGGVAQESTETTEVPIEPAKPSLIEKWTSGKNVLIAEIAAGIVIVVALGFVWHAVSSAIFPPKIPVSRPAIQAKQKPQPSPPRPANAPAAVSAPVAAPTNSLAPNAKPASVSPGPGATASAAKQATASPNEMHLESAVDAPLPRKGPAAPPTLVPAKIVTQPQPSMPEWAKGLDLDGVVKLDATIDSKGNLTETRVISGPRALQRAAQDAVQLWIFEPAQFGGKAVPTHLILVVEFQR